MRLQRICIVIWFIVEEGSKWLTSWIWDTYEEDYSSDCNVSVWYSWNACAFSYQIQDILQDIWNSKLDWDEVIDTKIIQKLKLCLAELNNLLNLKSKPFSVGVHFHILCDASQSAFVAVACFSVEDIYGNVKTAVTSSKSGTSPLKPITVPRVGLQAAFLGACLSVMVGKEQHLIIKSQYFWSDWRSALHCIRANHVDIIHTI